MVGPVAPIPHVAAHSELSSNQSVEMKHLPALVLMICVVCQTASARADSCAPGCKPGYSAGGAECVCFCRPGARQETVTKECFEVECEYICIPGIRFPWQNCCEPPSCGKVRRVRRLTSREYECGTRTVWEWEVICQSRYIGCTPPDCSRNAAPGCCAPMN